MNEKVVFPLRLPPDLHEALSKAAFELKISKQQFCQDAIREKAASVESGEEMLK